MPDNDDVIDHAVVRIGPDFSGFRLRTTAEIRKALAGVKPKIQVEVEYDTSAAIRNMVALRARMIREDQKMVRNFNEQVQRAERQAYAETQRLQQQTTAAAEREAQKRVRVAQREAQARKSAFAKATQDAQFIDWGGRGIRPMNLLYGVVTAMTPALFAMGSSALQASTSIAALGAAGVGAALGISGLSIAFQGLGDLLSLRKQVQAQATTDAANSVANAHTELVAQNNLLDAKRAELKAEKDLHDARREAARDLVDLRQKVADLQNQQREDTVSVAEAEANRNKVYRNYFASALDRARADQDLRNAKQRLSNTRLERQQAQQDLTESVRKGVEKSDKVTDARDNLRRARQRLQEQRLSDTASKTSSAAAQLKDKLAKASPALRELYTWIDRNAKRMQVWQRQMEQAFLPGFTTFLNEVSTPPPSGKSTIQFFADQAAELGEIIGQQVGEFGEWTNSPLFREQFGIIQRNNADALGLVGVAATKLRRPILRIVAAASPLLVKMADKLGQFATWLDEVIDTASRDGSLAKWFEDAWVQAERWINIGKNVLTLLGNLFKGSRTAGGGLVERFENFTKTLADWSGSEAGQGQITRFFDFFRHLPYADIAQTIGAATTLLLTWRVGSWAAKNPLTLLLSALGTFAASNPAAAAGIITTISGGLQTAVGFLASHPTETAALLAILAAGKVAKTFDLKIPGLETLKSKFGVLDKIFGGTASTGTMTVRAGVVNVYGAAGIGGGVDPKTGGSKTSNFLRNAGGTAAAVVIGEALMEYLDHLAYARTAPGAEQRAFANLDQDAHRYSFGGNMPVNDPTVTNRRFVKEYIEARKKNVAATVEQALATGDLATALQVERQENERSAHTLSVTLQRYGWTTEEAGKYARSVFGVAENTTTAITKSETWLTRLSELRGGVEGAALVIGDINTKIDEFSGKKVATLEVNGQDVVFRSLQEALTYQRALMSGLDLAAAGQAVLKDQERNRFRRYADGGKVRGYSPHSKADNIPALLTAEEYVQPVDAVKHYGVGFMEAIRTKQFPRFAEGGLVKMPFKVDISKTKIPSMMAPGGGIVTGDQDVARIAEATARAMGATEKQLIALFEAGLVESGMRNLTKAVDHDSLGFLQQRPSQGWGTPKQVLDVAFATRSFIRKAMRVDRGMYTPGQLAQAVQVSAFPDRYDKRYADALAIINAEAPFLAGLPGGNLGGAPYTGKIPKGLGNVTNVSAAIMQAILGAHAAYPGAKVTSSYRPGSRTRSGNMSYHSWDPSRAADFAPPSMGLFDYFLGRYGTTAKELIYSPAGTRQVKNGRSHMYTGGVRADHYDHVHLALANGGLVPTRKYDTGGTLPPGYTLAFNGTGRNETVRTAKQENALAGPLRLDRRDIAALAAHIAAANNQTVHMDGRKVAEITNTYTYLPGGV